MTAWVLYLRTNICQQAAKKAEKEAKKAAAAARREARKETKNGGAEEPEVRSLESLAKKKALIFGFWLDLFEVFKTLSTYSTRILLCRGCMCLKFEAKTPRLPSPYTQSCTFTPFAHNLHTPRTGFDLRRRWKWRS